MLCIRVLFHVIMSSVPDNSSYDTYCLPQLKNNTYILVGSVDSYCPVLVSLASQPQQDICTGRKDFSSKPEKPCQRSPKTQYLEDRPGVGGPARPLSAVLNRHHSFCRVQALTTLGPAPSVATLTLCPCPILPFAHPASSFAPSLPSSRPSSFRDICLHHLLPATPHLAEDPPSYARFSCIARSSPPPAF